MCKCRSPHHFRKEGCFLINSENIIFNFLHLQLFTAKVQSGFPVDFIWVIDSLESPVHHGDSYSVTFEKPAEHELQVNTYIFTNLF